MAAAKTPDTKTDAGTAAAADAPRTAADVAKLVKRPVTTVKDDQAKTALVPVGAEEVLAWKDYGDRVVVVTKDGQKFDSADTAAAAAAAA